LQQAKITEMFGLIALNPALINTIDPKKAVQRYLKINDEDPKAWMIGNGLTDDQWQKLAIQENNVMATGIPLVPTDGAPESHTMEHLHFMDTPAFEALPVPVRQNILQHVLGEDKARGGVGAELAQTAGIGNPAAPAAPGAPADGSQPIPPSLPGTVPQNPSLTNAQIPLSMPRGGIGSNTPARGQVADLQATIPGKAQAQNNGLV
jgi:hypothetical protein